jgi:mannose-6-phosphate isomerase
LNLTPLILRADNFTPSSRTPWGGTRIPTRFKPGLGAAPSQVGEAWEFSLDPAFPSRIARPSALEGALLSATLEADAAGWCGVHSAFTSLLLKLIDAANRLSLQVHPSDGYSGLLPGQCGKPEAWIILEREPGAGIWLGLAEGVQRADVEGAISAGRPLEPLLHFVPVEPGDAFVIEAGTVHAIGAGVTLLEPQLVRPGLSGVTYRFWDWGRRYDGNGQPDPSGQFRPLHLADALAVTRWDAPRGAAFEAYCRRHPVPLDAPPGLVHAHLLDLGPVRVERLRGEGVVKLATDDQLTVLLATSGGFTFGEDAATVGEAVVVPAALGALPLLLSPGTELFVLREGHT